MYRCQPRLSFLRQARGQWKRKRGGPHWGFQQQGTCTGLCQQNHVIAIFFEKVWPPSVGCPIVRRRLCSVSDFKTINHQVNRSNSQFPFPFFPYQVARREIESQDAYRSWSQT